MARAGVIQKILEVKGRSVSWLSKKLGYSAPAGLRQAIERNSTLKEDKVKRLFEIWPDLNPAYVESDGEVGPMLIIPANHEELKRIDKMVGEMVIFYITEQQKAGFAPSQEQIKEAVDVFVIAARRYLEKEGTQ